jgi:hypothetical protein
MIGKFFVNDLAPQEGSGRFLKKAAQKLSVVWAGGAETSTAQVTEVFLLLFVHKKKPSLHFPSPRCIDFPAAKH